MKIIFKWTLLITLLTLLISINFESTYANSCEPPTVIVIVNNPPKDLSIELISDKKFTEAKVSNIAWEGQYNFYLSHNRIEDTLRFKISAEGKAFECEYNGSLSGYNNMFTLDISNQRLTYGAYPFRQLILILIRLFFTILIEAIIFYLFKFRSRWSWGVFLITNVITQGILNWWLFIGISYLGGYLIFALVYGELFVFTAEMVIMAVLIKERKKGIIITNVLLANLLSLILGGFFIMVLPI